MSGKCNDYFLNSSLKHTSQKCLHLKCIINKFCFWTTQKFPGIKISWKVILLVSFWLCELSSNLPPICFKAENHITFFQNECLQFLTEMMTAEVQLKGLPLPIQSVAFGQFHGHKQKWFFSWAQGAALHPLNMCFTYWHD